MKLPRIMVRRLIVLVALAAVLLGLVTWMRRRTAYFRSEASRHIGVWKVLAPDLTPEDPGPVATYLWDMARKYELAAERPWLQVEPDPPEQE